MPTTKLQQFEISFNNNEEFHRLKQEVFTNHAYYFETENPQPYIIDAGAHIGLATLYFKKLYPASTIVSLEPHPTNFQNLETNIWANDARDVTTLPIALAGQVGTRQFYADSTSEQWFSTASFFPGAWNGDQTTESFTVATQPLSDFIDRPVDFLKMDIEGAEQEVLTAAQDKLNQIKHMMIEFHPHTGQSLSDLIKLLEQHGFKVTLHKKGKEIRLENARGLVLIEAQR